MQTLYSFSADGNIVNKVTWQSEYRDDTDSPDLYKLSLKSNKLATVPIESLKHLKKLAFLDLSGNLFTTFDADCMKGLESLQQLYLNSLPNLEAVHNFAFAEIEKLTLLEMRSNRKLAVIEEEAFLGLPLLNHVDLRANELNTLKPNTFDWLSLKYLDLRYNRWACNCDLKWLHDVLVDPAVNASAFYIKELHCSSPAEVASQRIIDVKDTLFKCSGSTDHEFKDRIMLGIFISFTILLIFVLLVLLYRYNYFQCFRNRLPQVPFVNYHANPVMNGHCHAIPCHNQNEEQIQIAANEVHTDDDAA